LAGEAVKRDLADKEKGDNIPDVDDTDGLDPEGEFEAWKLRELMRIKRDKEAMYAREKERDEIEARRAIPEALRLKEDTERAKKLREEKMANRGQQAFLQKYHHKGAFYTEENADLLKKHDHTATTENTIVSVDSLPEVMRVRNFGKMGRTKYTHLADQDTSDKNAGWSSAGRVGGSMGRQGAENLGKGCFNCGGPHVSRVTISVP
jgi:microfibrillar-associated protein 1